MSGPPALSSVVGGDGCERSLILGIETSCDETAASVIEDGRVVRSNVIASQFDLHEKFGGVVPEIASRAHIERILPVVEESLESAGIGADELTAIAVGNRPGLIGSLLVGVSAAKTMAWVLGKPLVGVDHVRAHLYAAALDDEQIAYPALGLVVSGGHTSLYRVDSATEMALMGRTIDDAAGEAFDKAAAILGLGFPGGPILDKTARGADPKAIRFPRTLLGKESLDFSFSGLKTSLLYHVCGQPQGRGSDAGFTKSAADLSEREIADVAASFQAAVVDVLIKKLERGLDVMASQGAGARSIVIGGGVSANSALREAVLGLGESRDLPVRLPRMVFCVDNAAMIAGLGHHQFLAGETAGLDLEAAATARV